MTLNHIQVAFVRQYLTRADDARGKFGRLVSRGRAAELMDEKVLASITEAYPHLTAYGQPEIQETTSKGSTR